MESVKKFFSEHGNMIITILLVLFLIQTCSQKSAIRSLKKSNVALTKSIDSLTIAIPKEICREIKIEGLRSESRMIQATDRKIWDMNRQNEIEKEIKKLNNEEGK